MSDKGKNGVHNPSRYRAIKRSLKSGGDQKELLEAARSVHDPYYASKAMADIGTKAKLERNKALQILEEALETLKQVDKHWRRAEILGYFCKAIGDLSHEQGKKLLWRQVLAAIREFPRGSTRSKAVNACRNHIDPGQFEPMLEIALSNPGQEVSDGKNVIRAWALSSPEKADDSLVDTIIQSNDDKIRAKLLGYLYLQACKGSIPCPSSVLEEAVGAALSLDGGDRTESLRYLALEAASDLNDLEIIHDALGRIEDPEVEARIISTLGARADDMGHAERAVQWFEEGLEWVKEIANEKEKSKVMLNLSKGLALCGESERAKTIMAGVDEDLRTDTVIEGKIKDLSKELDMAAPKEQDKKKERVVEIKRISTAGPRPVLGLYNTYQGGLKQVHLRAVARAAPLCWAFGLDLALIGFPRSDKDELVSRTIKETNIGKGGIYLKEMANSGGLLSLSKGPQSLEEWNQTGMPVATTSHPDKKKALNMSAVLKKASQYPAKRPLVIMGLGRKGLPAPVLAKVKHHLELTGQGIPMETCTAMGVIAQQLATAIKKS